MPPTEVTERDEPLTLRSMLKLTAEPRKHLEVSLRLSSVDLLALEQM